MSGVVGTRLCPLQAIRYMLGLCWGRKMHTFFSLCGHIMLPSWTRLQGFGFTVQPSTGRPMWTVKFRRQPTST